MEYLFGIDWHQLFVPRLSVLEILIRGIGVYVALCLLLRVVLKRQAGKVSLSDLLVITVVAGICRNPLVADAYSLPDGLSVVAVVLATSYAMDWLSYYSPLVHRILHPKPVQLVREGQVLRENLKRELMTEQRLYCQLRQEGVRDLGEVAEAWIEGSGQFSVIRRERPPADGKSGDEGPALNGTHAPADGPTGAIAAEMRWHEDRLADLRRALDRAARCGTP